LYLADQYVVDLIESAISGLNMFAKLLYYSKNGKIWRGR